MSNLSQFPWTLNFTKLLPPIGKILFRLKWNLQAKIWSFPIRLFTILQVYQLHCEAPRATIVFLLYDPEEQTTTSQIFKLQIITFQFTIDADERNRYA